MVEVEHPEDGETSLNSIDESQYCGVEDIARTDLVREVIHGNETVDCGFT